MEWRQLQQLTQQYNQQLVNLENWLKQVETISQQLEYTEEEIKRVAPKLQRLNSVLQDLQEDSFINKLKSFVGNRDEKLRGKLVQAATLELRLSESQRVYADLEADLVKLNHKINGLVKIEIEQNLQQTRREMEFWLIQHAPEQATRLTSIIGQENLVIELIDEINKAIVSGKEAQRLLWEAGATLEKANELSKMDTMGGGGIIVTHKKHERINQSNSQLHSVQIALQHFQNEIQDIQKVKAVNMAITVDRSISFADYFFDDIFSAWSVHKKIENSRDQLSLVMDDVRNTLLDLQRKLKEANEHRNVLTMEKEKIFTSTQESLFF